MLGQYGTGGDLRRNASCRGKLDLGEKCQNAAWCWGHYPHRIKQNWFQNMGWRSGEFQEIEVDALVNGEVDTGARR